jgi:hypothetical protein
MKAIQSIGIAMLVMGLGGLGLTLGHDGHDAPGPHGGFLADSGPYHFEIVFSTTGLKIYPLTADQKPLDASRLTCKATFVHPNAPDKTWFEMPCRVALPASGKAPSALNLDVDLSAVPATGAKVTFEIEGLSDTTAPRARFTVPFALKVPPTVVFTTATKTDAAAIAAQKVCKVSGEALGSMGTPIKASLGDRSTFLCCAECQKKFKVSPATYLPAPAAEFTVARTTPADQAAITTQKVCKVSGEDLTAMGGPLKVTRGDQSVLICCPSCLKDIKASPDKFFVARTATPASTSGQDQRAPGAKS